MMFNNLKIDDWIITNYDNTGDEINQIIGFDIKHKFFKTTYSKGWTIDNYEIKKYRIPQKYYLKKAWTLTERWEYKLIPTFIYRGG